MPLQRNTGGKPRLCIFGDSHLGSVKQCLDQGLVDLSAYDVEFWGATGPEFRQLDMQNGVITPRGAAAETVARINGKGRKTIAAQDFDLFLFYGARLKTIEFMAPYLHRAADPNSFETDAALRAAAEAWLIMTRAFRFARVFAGAGASVVFVPGPLPTEKVKDYTIRDRVLQAWPLAAQATAQHRARIWDALEHQAASTGVTLIRQPEQTITNGTFTRFEYAVENAIKSGDTGHKNTSYAALMLEQALIAQTTEA